MPSLHKYHLRNVNTTSIAFSTPICSTQTQVKLAKAVSI